MYHHDTPLESLICQIALLHQCRQGLVGFRLHKLNITKAPLDMKNKRRRRSNQQKTYSSSNTSTESECGVLFSGYSGDGIDVGNIDLHKKKVDISTYLKEKIHNTILT